MESKLDFYKKKMFGGVAFMINEKMCIGITNKNQIMLRVLEEHYEHLLESGEGFSEMNFTGKPMKGFLFIDEDSFLHPEMIKKCINYAIEFGDKGVVKSKKKTK